MAIGSEGDAVDRAFLYAAISAVDVGGTLVFVDDDDARVGAYPQLAVGRFLHVDYRSFAFQVGKCLHLANAEGRHVEAMEPAVVRTYIGIVV